MKRQQEEHCVNAKILYVWFVDIGKTFNRVLMKVLEWAMRMKGMSEILLRSIMSLYEGAKIIVRVNSDLSKEIDGYFHDLDCHDFLR